MLRSVRDKALLGPSPQHYLYMNEADCKNNVLKQQLMIKYKATELLQFVEHNYEETCDREVEVERAVTTAREYRLTPNYSHLAVSTQRWFTKNEQQQQWSTNRFFRTYLCTDLPTNGKEDEQLVADILERMKMKSSYHQK